MSALAAASGPAAGSAASSAAADSSEEVQRLRLLVRKLEHQNNLLRARSLSSGLSDCGVVGARDGGGSGGDYEFHAETGRAAAGRPGGGGARPDERRFGGASGSGGATLDDVRVLDIMDDYTLDEDDSWLYVSPSKSCASPPIGSKNGYDADKEVAWATDSLIKSPQVWLRQDLDNPSPEVRMVRRSLAFTLDEILHASFNQPSASPMYSRGGSGMARSAADLSTSGRMSPAIKPALLANTASLDAGTFIKARRNILTSAGSTPDVATGDTYQMSRHDSTGDVSPGFAARAASPGVYGTHVESSIAEPSASSGLRVPDGYPSSVNTGTFTRRRKLPAASEEESQHILSPSSSVSRSTASTAAATAAPMASVVPSTLQLPGASQPTAHLSRSCDNIPAGNLTGRGIFVAAASHSGADPFGKPTPPPATRASCEALDQIQAMARMQEQSLRDDVNNSIRRNSISSGSVTRSMSIGSASPAAVGPQATTAFFNGPAPRESSGVPQMSSSSRAASAASADRASNNGWANGPASSGSSSRLGGVQTTNGLTLRPALSAEVLAQQQLLQLQQQAGRASTSGGGSGALGTPGARLSASTATPSRQASASAVGQAMQQHHQASPQQRYHTGALAGADLGRSGRRSLPQTPAAAVQSAAATAAAPSRSARGVSPSSREVAGFGLGSSRYSQQQQKQTPQRPQSSAAAVGGSQSKGMIGNRYTSPPRAAPKGNVNTTGVRRAISTATTSRPPSQPSTLRRSGNGYF